MLIPIRKLPGRGFCRKGSYKFYNCIAFSTVYALNNINSIPIPVKTIISAIEDSVDLVNQMLIYFYFIIHSTGHYSPITLGSINTKIGSVTANTNTTPATKINIGPIIKLFKNFFNRILFRLLYEMTYKYKNKHYDTDNKYPIVRITHIH